MSKPVEEAASRSFIQALFQNLDDEATRKEVEYMVETVFPVLIPGIVHLLKAHSENQRRIREADEEGGEAATIQPLDHLARYLMRHNPRHHEPTAEATELRELARKLLHG